MLPFTILDDGFGDNSNSLAINAKWDVELGDFTFYFSKSSARLGVDLPSPTLVLNGRDLCARPQPVEVIGP